MSFLLMVKEYVKTHRDFLLSCIRKIGLIVLIILSCLFIYDKLFASHEIESKPSKVINADGTINTNKHYQEATKVQTNTIERTTIQYVPKENPFDADLELDNSNKKVFVKVNGQQHEIENNVTETQKFENGKLVVTQKEESIISIAAPKPAKFSVSYYYGGGNNQGVGLHYNVSKHLTADALYINHKAYAGITVPIGNMDSSSKKQDVSNNKKKEGK